MVFESPHYRICAVGEESQRILGLAPSDRFRTCPGGHLAGATNRPVRCALEIVDEPEQQMSEGLALLVGPVAQRIQQMTLTEVVHPPGCGQTLC